MLRFYFLQNNQTSLVKFIAHIGPTGEDSLRPDPVSTPKGKLWGVWSEWAARNWKKRALDGMFIMFCNSASHWSCELRSRSALPPQRGRLKPWDTNWDTSSVFLSLLNYSDQSLPCMAYMEILNSESQGTKQRLQRQLRTRQQGLQNLYKEGALRNYLTACGAGENVRRLHVHLSTVSTVSLSEVALGAVDGVAYWTALKRPVLQFFKEKALSTYRDLVWSV